MEDQKLIPLDPPIMIGDMEYFSIALREPTAGELERATKGNPPAMKTVIDLLAMVAGVPRQVIEKLPQRKFREASEYVSGFTEDGPTTGEDQSPS
ncbi:phage tail assembly protein [Achromobacter sp. AONIH1]|uniref:phage tail assembly protein n=1 Tax=Achromobacter sp. AONIH1 TaxID=1758194 RepID=UPI000CD0A1E7|nr:phage tail assembly protein [Achromobacter sp. AONIH1]AUT47014.1 phage tail assembly protein [Achromobacter sp. AONIH1]